MTVRDLIKELLDYPMEYEVQVDDAEYGLLEVETVEKSGESSLVISAFGD